MINVRNVESPYRQITVEILYAYLAQECNTCVRSFADIVSLNFHMCTRMFALEFLIEYFVVRLEQDAGTD
jgi:hypothetical protein